MLVEADLFVVIEEEVVVREDVVGLRTISPTQDLLQTSKTPTSFLKFINDTTHSCMNDILLHLVFT